MAKNSPKIHKTVEQKKNEIQSESDDDEDVEPGMYVVKCLHEVCVQASQEWFAV